MPIDTTKDLLYIVLAFSVLWLTVFLSWALYYLIAILRDAESVTRQARRISERVESVAEMVQEKFSQSLSFLSPMADMVKGAVAEKIGERLAKRRSASRKRAKDEDEE